MNTLLQIPDWLGTALVGATLAALGYVGKLFVELFQAFKERERTKRSKLIELQSLLRATKTAFVIQNSHARKLTNSIETNYSGIAEKYTGYEEKISRAFDSLNTEEKELHAIIRSITINTLYPINTSILEWLRSDNFFKATKSKKPEFSKLAAELVKLESHLLLWIAKYKAWIPEHNEHALVYMADENEHGLGFPSGIDERVDDVVNKF